MATQRCAKCGAFGPPGTTFCAFCGTPFGSSSGAPAPPTSGSAPTAFGPPAAGTVGWYSPTGSPATSPTEPSAEREALTYVIWAAYLILAAGVFSLVASLFGSGYSGGTITLSPALVVATVLGGVCELAVVVLFFLSFRRLAPHDRRFSTPYHLSLLLAIAIVILVAIFDPLLTASNHLTTCVHNAGSNTTAEAACVQSGDLLAFIGLTLLAGVLALVGYIGLLIGIWRLGNRYSNGYFKVGAILLIIPIANLVGGVLILVAARGAREPPGAAYRP